MKALLSTLILFSTFTLLGCSKPVDDTDAGWSGSGSSAVPATAASLSSASSP